MAAVTPLGEPVRLVVDQAPLTLNPRMALDASGQRIGALLFSALTRIGPTFATEPDLASAWQSDALLRRWTFTLASGHVDHAGRPITPKDVYACLEEYRQGKPRSLVGANFTRWKETRFHPPRTVEVVLSEADPYFPKNASLLRFFRAHGEACVEPQPGETLVGSGPLRPERWETAPREKIRLNPVDPAKTRAVELVFVRDELTRLLHLLRGSVDGGLIALSLSKTAWLAKHHPQEFTILEKPGVNVQYLAFNLRHPILSKVEVRQALSLAINRDAYAKQKSFGFLTTVGSFLAPGLEEAESITPPFDPTRAEKLLDQAGYPRQTNGERFTLRYKTTPLRDGFEIALYVRESLKQIGVRVEIETVESALLIASMRKGNFDLYSSRWVGVSDASILWRTLHSGSASNRVGYKNPSTDQMLQTAMQEANPIRRTALMKKIQIRMAEDLPYAPLWIWNTQFIVRKERAGEFSPALISPSAALEPLTRRNP